MNILIYPGTFDPFTNGHIDIVKRAANISDMVYVAVMSNSSKKTVFSVEERVAMAKISIADIKNVIVESFEGLLVDYFKEKKADAVVRGLRSESDFRYEAELSAANKLLCPEFEAILLPCRMDLAFTSSTIVREVALYGGDVTGMVSPKIVNLIKEKYKHLKEDKGYAKPSFQ